MNSGSTAFTVALVPTAMKAGVRISPCGVLMIPVRPRNSPPFCSIRAADGAELSVSRVPTRKENPDCPDPPLGEETVPTAAPAEGEAVGLAVGLAEAAAGLADTVPVCQLAARNPHRTDCDVG